jgi:hypothetical protein
MHAYPLHKEEETIVMKAPKIYYGVLIVFCALVILSGTVHAADIPSPGHGTHSITSTGHNGSDLKNSTPRQQIITKLQSAGVDAASLKTDLAGCKQMR